MKADMDDLRHTVSPGRTPQHKRWSITYIRPHNAALSPPKVLCQVQYALIASFLLDTASVFAAVIGSVDGGFLAEMIQYHIK